SDECDEIEYISDSEEYVLHETGQAAENNEDVNGSDESSSGGLCYLICCNNTSEKKIIYSTIF
ncbi:MAG TPA: hypothetical protein VGC17_07270, partial [Lactovum miscens]|uniref:hypothetical protein n=1 Tax=Lactovum miscens TaxID=190387 RepID=UPI002ED87945